MSYDFPCKNCPKKGCGTYHSQCLDYQEAVKKNNEQRKKQRERKDRERWLNWH